MLTGFIEYPNRNRTQLDDNNNLYSEKWILKRIE